MNLNFFLCLPFFFPPRALSQSFPPFCFVFKVYVPTFCTLPGLLFTSLSAFTMSLGLERGIVLSCREFCRPLGGDKTYAPVGVSYPNDRLALPSLGTLGVVVSGERRRPSTLLKKRYNKQKLSTHSFQNTQDNQNFPKHSRSTKISKHSRLFCFVVLLRSLSCCLFFSQCLSPCVSPCLCPSMCLFLPVCLCLCHCLSFFCFFVFLVLFVFVSVLRFGWDGAFRKRHAGSSFFVSFSLPIMSLSLCNHNPHPLPRVSPSGTPRPASLYAYTHSTKVRASSFSLSLSLSLSVSLFLFLFCLRLRLTLSLSLCICIYLCFCLGPHPNYNPNLDPNSN